MKIVTWNVNSIRTRMEHVLDFLEDVRPDVLLLQELKVDTPLFPHEPLEDLGYNIAVAGQKTYNGVAILSKYPLEDIQTHLPGEEERPAARYIEAVTNNVRVASIYVPNGQEVGHEKYAYKLSFLENLYTHMQRLFDLNEKTVLGGDYNIAPTGNDTYDAQKFQNRILVSDPERAAFRRLVNIGYTDALRAANIDASPESLFTWWDYRQGSWEQNRGLRIDHFLLSPEASDVMANCHVETKPRSRLKPSDHAPVVLTLSI